MPTDTPCPSCGSTTHALKGATVPAFWVGLVGVGTSPPEPWETGQRDAFRGRWYGASDAGGGARRTLTVHHLAVLTVAKRVP